MLTVKRFSNIAGAHHLPNYDGKCSNIHGHTWTIEVGIEGPVDHTSGMVIDFVKLKEGLQSLIDKLDHHDLNETIYNPTAENIVEFIRTGVGTWLEQTKLTRTADLRVALIRVWEAPDSYAEWSIPKQDKYPYVTEDT